MYHLSIPFYKKSQMGIRKPLKSFQKWGVFWIDAPRGSTRNTGEYDDDVFLFQLEYKFTLSII